MPFFPSAHVVTADEWPGPARVVMSSDQALTVSSTTFQSLTALVIPVLANAKYDGVAVLAAADSSGAAEDVKYGFTFPAGSTLHVGQAGPDISIASGTSGIGDWTWRPNVASGATAAVVGATAGGAYMTALLSFSLDVGGSSGNLQVQAAQFSSGANTITVRLGSKLILWRSG